MHSVQNTDNIASEMNEGREARAKDRQADLAGRLRTPAGRRCGENALRAPAPDHARGPEAAAGHGVETRGRQRLCPGAGLNEEDERVPESPRPGAAEPGTRPARPGMAACPRPESAAKEEGADQRDGSVPARGGQRAPGGAWGPRKPCRLSRGSPPHSVMASGGGGLRRGGERGPSSLQASLVL